MIWWLQKLFDIPGALAKAYDSHQKASTEKERLKWDHRVRELEAKRETILKAQSDPVERWVRVLLAAPFVIYINKLVIWDKVLGLGATDALSPELAEIMWLVLLGYFVDSGVRRFFGRR